MPTLDECHFQVVRALQKDGWQVDDKPKYIYDDESESFVFIDIVAILVAEDESMDRRMCVEVKCFPGYNPTQELHIALGQYILYRSYLARQNVTLPLYLSVPKSVYDVAFHVVVQATIRDNGIKLVIVDLEKEVVEAWIE